MEPKRRARLARFIGYFALLTVASTVAPTSVNAQAADEQRARIIVFAGNSASLPVWIADTFGFFKEEKLRIEYVAASTGITGQTAMVAEQTDFTIGSVSQTASLQAQGVDAVVAVGLF